MTRLNLFLFFGVWSVCGNVNGNECPASVPCLCDGEVVECEAQSLTEIHAFRIVRRNYRILKYGTNDVTAVNAAAFAGLNVTEIHLDFNKISFIDPRAFQGMEKLLKILNLAHNRLQTIPEAIGNLMFIADLDISFNSINGYKNVGNNVSDGFTETVMTDIGDTLAKFSFGDQIMLTRWPKSTHHLQQLEELRISGSTVNLIPHGAFHGFEHTLKKLSVSHCGLQQLPIEINELTQIEELHFDYNRIQDGDSVIIEQPFTVINKTLKVLSLRYDNLKVIPNVMRYLGRLQNLSMDGNPLEFISEEAMSFVKHTQVKILSLRDCRLKRIPGSLSDISNLMEINLSQNLIRTIESNDLRNLHSLTKLSLSRNPLKFISQDTFVGLDALSVLDLSYSTLTQIPESIASLYSLEILDLRNANVDCTCELTWVKRLMDLVQFTIRGDCETINQSILKYVTERIPRCPAFYVNVG